MPKQRIRPAVLRTSGDLVDGQVFIGALAPPLPAPFQHCLFYVASGSNQRMCCVRLFACFVKICKKGLSKKFSCPIGLAALYSIPTMLEWVTTVGIGHVFFFFSIPIVNPIPKTQGQGHQNFNAFLCWYWTSFCNGTLTGMDHTAMNTGQYAQYRSCEEAPFITSTQWPNDQLIDQIRWITDELIKLGPWPTNQLRKWPKDQMTNWKLIKWSTTNCPTDLITNWQAGYEHTSYLSFFTQQQFRPRKFTFKSA